MEFGPSKKEPAVSNRTQAEKYSNDLGVNHFIIEHRSSGTFAYGIGVSEEYDPGFAERQKIVVDAKDAKFAIVSGGGEGAGEAANILAQALHEAFEKGISPVFAHRMASLRIRRLGSTSTASYLAAWVENGRIFHNQLGNVKMLVVNRPHVAVRESTKLNLDFEDPNLSPSHYVSGSTPPVPFSGSATVVPGDRAIVGSFELWDAFSDGEVANIVKGEDTKNALNKLSANLIASHHPGGPILIYDIKRVGSSAEATDRRTFEESYISSVKSIEELASLLSSDLQGLRNVPHGLVIGSQEFVNVLFKVRDGLLDLKYIPSEHGLRKKVAELLGVVESKTDNDSDIQETTIRKTLERKSSAFEVDTRKSRLILEASPIIRELWPDGLEERMMQGGSGDCYFLAALQAIKRNPNFAVVLTKMLEKDSKGNWSVRFHDDGNTEKQYTITKGNVWKMSLVGKSVDLGSPGDLILERAYARFIKRTRAEQRGESPYSRNTVPWTGGDMEFEGGVSTDAWRHFFGRGIEAWHEHSGRLMLQNLKLANEGTVFSAYTFDPKSLLDHLLSLNKKARKLWLSDSKFAYLKLVGSRVSSESFFEGITYKVRTVDGATMNLDSNHAYALGHINKEEEWVEIINPHDTKKKVFRVSFGEFALKFSRLAIGKLK